MIFARRPRKEQAQPTALELIEATETHLLAATWKGSPCGLVKVRILSDIQIQSLGNFSLIETEEYKWSRSPEKKTTWAEMLSYANLNMKICMAALVSPSYEQIFELIGKMSFNGEVKVQVEHINKMLMEMPEGPAKQELEEKRDNLIIAWNLILPADFIGAVVADALEINKTDIKKVTEEILYNAAVLANRGHKAPHEYAHGIFSFFNIRDFDSQAWITYDSRLAEAKKQAQNEKIT